MSAPAAPAPRPAWIAWTDAPALVALAAYYFGQPPARVDDAYIFYRYAANWAAGLGPVFNPGERVEGFSSVLWTMLLTLTAKIGIAPEFAGPALSGLFTAGTLVLVGHAARRLLPGAVWAHVLVPLGAALSAGVVFYAASGLDTAIFGFVLTGAALAALDAIERREYRPMMLWLPLLVIVRAEGPVYAVALLALTYLVARQRGAWDVRSGFGPAGFTVIVIAILFLVRYSFFGEWLPSSMRSKSVMTHTLGEVLHHRESPRELIRLLWRGARDEMLAIPLLVPPLAAIALQFVRRRGLASPALVYLLLAGLGVGISVWAAGDWMPFNRHAVPTWGLVLLMLVWAGLELGGRAGPVLAALLLVAGAWRGMEGVPRIGNPLTARALRGTDFDVWQTDVARTLAAMEPPPIVAANMVGEFPYRGGPNLYVRDILGLTDAHNAKYGADWVPTYGRTDPVYTFGSRVDVMFTTTARDLWDLWRHAREPDGTRRRYVLHANPRWLEKHFILVSREGTPYADAVAKIAGAPSVPMDSVVIAVVRKHELAAKGWLLTGLGEDVLAAARDSAR